MLFEFPKLPELFDGFLEAFWRVQLENQTDVYVNVYNLSGRLVQTIKKSNLASGTQLIQLDGNKLSTGTYIVKFQAGNVKETIKFVKL